ncbi:MAG: dihydropteroate synthase [Candidatus Thorarchaeota archaeon]|nr:MAG: dihydropteroate synthase [Candidatus Thorarchaeota archaeon]
MKYHTVVVDRLNIGRDFPVRIMGVINLSPESFYRGSVAEELDEVGTLVRKLDEAGADLIDVGGASSAPTNIYGTQQVTRDEELRRVSSTMDVICESTKKPISIDTTSARIAAEALDLGASLVNDISGLKSDPEMASLIAVRDVPVIIMANCKAPCTSCDSVFEAIERSLQAAASAGISSHQIIVDPGFGFGKPYDVDFEILRNLDRFASFGHPVLVGLSRKAFIGSVLQQPNPESRLAGTIAATSLAVARGANVVRTHDVQEAATASIIGSAMRNW